MNATGFSFMRCNQNILSHRQQQHYHSIKNNIKLDRRWEHTKQNQSSHDDHDLTTHDKETNAISTRRSFIINRSTIATLSLLSSGKILQSTIQPSYAIDDDNDEQSEDTYQNPNIPAMPEERSGLVVLRVAEVCQFQEKIIKATLAGDIDTTISPFQIAFGTNILLKNSNIAGNMKLMIETEIPASKRDKAATYAANTMNTLQNIVILASKVQRPFEKEELKQVADMFRYTRLQLNAMYELLSEREKKKYYGYFMAVTDYEKKIAEGVYNPEIDGVLKFDD